MFSTTIITLISISIILGRFLSVTTFVESSRIHKYYTKLCKWGAGTGHYCSIVCGLDNIFSVAPKYYKWPVYGQQMLVLLVPLPLCNNFLVFSAPDYYSNQVRIPLTQVTF